MAAGNPRRSLCGAQALSDLIPRLAITPGEPAGIGPDILLAALQAPRPAQWLAVADPQLLRERAALLGLPLKLTEFDPAQPARAQGPGELCVSPVPLAVPAEPGRLNPANAPYVLACLDRAVDLCQTGQCQALVTGPVQKSVINDAGIAFTGHTEYLAHKAGCQVVMMLATEGLRVALATTHVPLSAVPGAISRASLTRVIEILLQDLRRQFGIARPRLLVCGLNPHAGEGGHLGREEIEVIEPVLEALRGPHCELIGPLPADTLFQPKYLQGADAVLAMYHDQGLPVLKYRGFGAAVNITLGLPYIRTSVDHGTALDLAATGRADTGSLQTAIQYATGMINARLSANNGTET